MPRNAIKFADNNSVKLKIKPHRKKLSFVQNLELKTSFEDDKGYTQNPRKLKVKQIDIQTDP